MRRPPRIVANRLGHPTWLRRGQTRQLNFCVALAGIEKLAPLGSPYADLARVEAEAKSPSRPGITQSSSFPIERASLVGGPVQKIGNPPLLGLHSSRICSSTDWPLSVLEL